MSEVRVLNIATGEIEKIQLEFSVVYDYIKNNSQDCRLYTEYSYYSVCDTDREVLVKIDNISRNIVSFTADNLKEIYPMEHTTSIYRTCNIKSVIPKLQFKFNVRSSISKYMFSFSEGTMGLVDSELKDINRLRSVVYRTGNVPRKLLMWEFLSAPGLVGDNYILGINFVSEKFIDIKDDMINRLLKMSQLKKDCEDFRKYFLKVSGFQLSDGTEPPTQEFDFTSLVDNDLPVRKRQVNEELSVVKEKIAFNGRVAMGITSHKIMDKVLFNKFVSRRMMIYKHFGIIPSISLIDFRGMFGFYPIWYLHPDLTLYSDGTQLDLLESLEVIDAEDAYDTEDETLEVWKYFVPYYMSDDWDKYVQIVAEEKSRLLGYEEVLIKELINEKDFIDFMLINKVKLKPRQLTNIYGGKFDNGGVHFTPGEIPHEYDVAFSGRRCNVYLFKVADSEDVFVRDCVNLKTIPIPNLGSSPKDSYLKRLADLMMKHGLVFTKVCPTLFLLEKDDYVFLMSQQGAVDGYKREGFYNLVVPIIRNDDLRRIVQKKRYNCFTGTDKFYNYRHGTGKLPDLLERALYRLDGLDLFIKESESDIEAFGTRRNPTCETKLQSEIVENYIDLREVYNFFSGCNLMQWLRMGARGNDSSSAFLESADWDRIIWYCRFNTWLAYIEIPVEKDIDGYLEAPELVICDNYHSDYCYNVYDFYSVGDVCMIKGDFSGKPWRLCIDCYPMQYINIMRPFYTNIIEERVFEKGKGNGIFIIEFNDEDILYHGRRFMIISADGERYLISGEESRERVIQNEIIDNLSSEVLNQLSNTNLVSYETVFRNFMVSPINETKKVSDNLYYVRCFDLGIGNKGDISNIHGKIASKGFWCYVGSIIFVFDCDEQPNDIQEISRDGKKMLIVDGKEFVWNYRKNSFVRQISEKEEEVEEKETEEKETEENEMKEEEVEEETEVDKKLSNNDWLYTFDTNYFDSDS